MTRFVLSLLLAVAAVQGQTTITLGADTGAAMRPLLGVNDGPTPTGESTVELTSRYQDAGVTMIRTQDNAGPFDTAFIYPNQNADPTKDSSYNWTASDALFRAILNGGFEPYLRLGTVSGAAGAVTNAANYTVAAVAIVRRYTDATRWGKNAVRYVEFWNEPDSRTYWTGTPEAFQQLYISVAKSVRAAFPSLKIGCCGFTGLQYSPLPGTQQGTWLKPFLASVQSAGAPLDFLSWHTYLINPGDITTGATYFRTQLNAYGFRSAESILSEWNTDFEGPQGGDAALRTGARGSAILAATWINLQSTDVAYSMLYRGPDPSLSLPTFYGMWYADGRPKPAALAQTLFSQMVKYPTRLSATVAPSGLYVLAGRNASGDRAVLLANPTSASVAWSLGGTTGNGRTYRLQQLADTATSITTSSPTGLSGSIPANGVQLLTITAGDGAAITGVAGAGGSVPAVASITSNGYFAIYGSDFAPAGTSREVQQSDLTGNTFPTKLANTCVNVGNTRAYLRYVSPGQINALAPALTGASAQVSVVVNCGTAGEQTSAVVTVPVASAAPEFLYFAQTAGGQNPVVAVDSLTGAYVGQNGLIPGVSFTPAKAGQLVTVFGIGFGRLVSPVSPGTLVTGANGVADGASVSIGGRAATVSYAGATPGFAGLYQVNLVVPAGLSPGNQEVTATINGFETARGGYLTVQ